MVQSIRGSLKKGGVGVEFAYQQTKALLDLLTLRNDKDMIPTDMIVKAYKQASKLLFLLSQCEQSLPEVSKQQIIIMALKSLLKLRHLLPSLDQRLANPNFPVNVDKHVLKDLDMLDF